MKQKITNLIAVAFMLLFALPVMAYEAEIDGIFYRFSGNNAIVTYETYGGESYSGDIVIPSSVTYNGREYTVTQIGNEAFHGCANVTSVVIPESVTNIGEYAFRLCSSMTSVNIPAGIQVLNKWCFAECTSLESIVIPESVTEIGACVFYQCRNLTSMNFPSGIVKVGASAFEDTPWFNEQPDGLVYIGNVAYKYKGEIPSGTEITLREGTVCISGECFWEWQCTGLTSITIPNTVTSIGFGAFYNCGRLTSITLPNSLVEIENTAFAHCSSLTSIVIPSSVKSLGGTMFSCCYALESIVVESGNTVFDSRENCNAIIRTSNNVMIEGCKSTTFPEGIAVIGRSALSNTRLTSAVLPNSLKSIGEYAFQDCDSLTSIVIPDSVTFIDAYAFRMCSNLATVSLGRSVRSIYSEAFADMRCLTDMYCYADEVPYANSNVFKNSKVDENATLHVPYQLLEEYRTRAPWSSFKEIVPITIGKCEAPTITLLPNGRVKVESATEGATCVTNITATNAEPITDGEISLTEALVVYTVTAYATAEAYEDSDVTTYTFTLERTENDINGDGVLNVGDVTRLISLILGAE